METIMSKHDWDWDGDYVLPGWTIYNQYPNANTNALAGALQQAPYMTPGVSGGSTIVSDVGRVDSSTVLTVRCGLSNKIFFTGTASQIASKWDDIIHDMWHSVGKSAMSFKTWKERANTPIWDTSTNPPTMTNMSQYAAVFNIPNVGNIFFNSNDQALRYLQRSTTPISGILDPIVNDMFAGTHFSLSANDYQNAVTTIEIGNAAGQDALVNSVRQQIANSASVQEVIKTYEEDLMGIDPTCEFATSFRQILTNQLASGSTNLAQVRIDAVNFTAPDGYSYTYHAITDFIKLYQGVYDIPQPTKDWAQFVANSMTDSNNQTKLVDVQGWIQGYSVPTLPTLQFTPYTPLQLDYALGNPSGDPEQFESDEIHQYVTNYVMAYQEERNPIPAGTRGWIDHVSRALDREDYNPNDGSRNTTLADVRGWVAHSDLTHQKIEGYIHEFQKIQAIPQPTEDWINTVQDIMAKDPYQTTTLDTIRGWIAHSDATTNILVNYVKQYQGVATVLSSDAMQWIANAQDALGHGVIHMSQIESTLGITNS